MTWLGISSGFHDSAAALIDDSRVIFAIQEERLTRRKGDSSLPLQAISRILESQQAKKIQGISFSNV